MAANGVFRSPMTLPCFHDISVEALSGHAFKLDRYKGKVVLIVNTASFGHDSANVFNQLNILQAKYSEDLAVLGFPCNQFRHSVSSGSMLWHLIVCTVQSTITSIPSVFASMFASPT
jgi:hypothetical protein